MEKFTKIKKNEPQREENEERFKNAKINKI